MGRQASSFSRRPPRYEPQPRVLILCEDKKSCLVYLQEAAQHFRCNVQVKVAHVGKTDPRGIVAEAKRRHKDHEHVYCAIDRDTHETFDEAIRHAAVSPVVEVIASHPCYEFWLLLHYRKTRSPFAASGKHSAADKVARALREVDEMKDYAKGGSVGLFAALLPRLPRARTHAAQVLDQALDEGEMNPSTRLHVLIDLFESLAGPQPLIV